MNKKNILKRTAIICGIIIMLDQIIKCIIIKICSNYDIEIIKNIISITKIENIGIAFSLNEGNIKNIILSGAVIFFIFRYLFTQTKYLNKITVTSLDFILAGGISNLLDRVIRGAVIDFIKILNFPIFNLADIFIILGWGMFSFYFLKFELHIDKSRRK